MAIRIDFINDFTYLLHFYFSENAKVRKTIRRKKLIFNNFQLINYINLRYFNVKLLVEITSVVKWILCKIILVI